jgi:hypothetical protein
MSGRRSIHEGNEGEGVRKGRERDVKRAVICELRGPRLAASLGRQSARQAIRLAVLISNGHDAFHSEHHRLHLGFRQDLNPGLHAVAAFPALRRRRGQLLGRDQRPVETYRKRGYHISSEIGYLNHLLTYVLAGQMPKLNNRVLRECGAEIKFYPGLPEFFSKSRLVQRTPGIPEARMQLEHYIVSTGLAEMIQGSAIAAPRGRRSGAASSSRIRCSRVS